MIGALLGIVSAVVFAALVIAAAVKTPHGPATRQRKAGIILARAVLVVLNMMTLLVCALTWLWWPAPPENPFDRDPLVASAFLVVVWASLSTLTAVLTGVAVRLRSVDNKWWIMVPAVLLIFAITVGMRLRIASREYHDPTDPANYSSTLGILAWNHAHSVTIQDRGR